MKKHNEYSSKKLASLAGGVEEKLKDYSNDAPLLVYNDRGTRGGTEAENIGYTVGDFKSLAGSVLTQARDKKVNRKIRKAVKKLSRKKGKHAKTATKGKRPAKARKVHKGPLRGTRRG